VDQKLEEEIETQTWGVKMSGWAAAAQAATELGGQIYSGAQARKARKFDLYKLQNQIQWRVQDAKKAGLHPLAALGISPASGASVMAGSSGISKMGQSIGQLINRTSGEGKELRQLNLLKQREELKQAKIVTLGMEREYNDIKNTNPVPVAGDPVSKRFGIVGQPDQTVGVSSKSKGPAISGQGPAVEMITPEIPYSGQLGYESGVNPAYRYDVDPGGHVTSMPSTKSQEALESSPFLKAKDFIRRSIRHVKGITDYLSPQFEGTRRAQRELRKFRPRNPPAGWEYRYNPWWGEFVLAKKGKGQYGSRFYDGGLWKFIKN